MPSKSAKTCVKAARDNVNQTEKNNRTAAYSLACGQLWGKEPLRAWIAAPKQMLNGDAAVLFDFRLWMGSRCITMWTSEGRSGCIFVDNFSDWDENLAYPQAHRPIHLLLREGWPERNAKLSFDPTLG